MLVLAVMSTAAPVVIAACWLISCWRTSAVVERITTGAIKDCPPERRAAIIRASAELASRLRGEHPAAPADVLQRTFRQRLPSG
jgi:hypothetical protein